MSDMTLVEIEIALDRALHFKVNDMSDDTIGAYEAWRAEKLQDFKQKLETRDAAQRQAGREEAMAEMADNAVRLKKHYDDALEEVEGHYAAVVEAARKAVKEFDLWDLVEALRELDEAREG